MNPSLLKSPAHPRTTPKSRVKYDAYGSPPKKYVSTKLSRVSVRLGSVSYPGSPALYVNSASNRLYQSSASSTPADGGKPAPPALPGRTSSGPTAARGIDGMFRGS